MAILFNPEVPQGTGPRRLRQATSAKQEARFFLQDGVTTAMADSMVLGAPSLGGIGYVRTQNHKYLSRLLLYVGIGCLQEEIEVPLSLTMALQTVLDMTPSLVEALLEVEDMPHSWHGGHGWAFLPAVHPTSRLPSTLKRCIPDYLDVVATVNAGLRCTTAYWRFTPFRSLPPDILRILNANRTDCFTWTRYVESTYAAEFQHVPELSRFIQSHWA